MKGAKSYKAALLQLSAYLKAHEMRPSAVRNMVLEQVCQLPQPFTADQLTKACQEERISVGTVYNALNVFVLAQILHATNRQRGKSATEYELMSGNQIRMQVVCHKCGRVTEIQDKAVERLVKERKYSNFTMQHFSLFVYGECKICRRLVKKNNNNGNSRDL